MTSIVQTIRPGVVVDGDTYYPSGQMWIMSFALAGCKWAIDEIKKDPMFEEKFWFNQSPDYLKDGDGI